MNIIKTSFYLMVGLFLTACAGKHTLPDMSYSKQESPLRNFSIAYDQNGNFYPQHNQTEYLFNWLGEYNYSPFSSDAFTLTGLGKSGFTGYYYDKSTDKKLTDDFANTLSSALTGLDKLYVFIHGFNNKYTSAKDNIDVLKRMINTQDGVSLSVFWDGLHDGFALNFYPHRWNKALTYSNFAGQFGLRELIQGLDRPIELVFITHSRGAAVALSTLFDPAYDSHIVKPALSTPLTAKHVSKAKMLLLAPAIGDGHLSANLINNKTVKFPVEIYTSSNTEDFATCKSFLGGARDGDTRLGCGKYKSYIATAEIQLNKLTSVFMKTQTFNEDRWSFWETDSHAVQAYLDNTETQIMMCQYNFARAEWCKDKGYK